MESQERIKKALSIATDTKVFELGQDILDRVPQIYNRFFSGRKAVVVADENTWRVAGENVFSFMLSYGIDVKRYIVDEKEFHAEWRYVEMVDRILDGDFESARRIEKDPEYKESDASLALRQPSQEYYVAVSVGSGTINDLCKLASFHHGQQYMSVPTAASVDGFSSFGASITYQNAKQTFDCPAPVALVADVDVIANAPKEMTASGFADLAAKIPSGGEWILADVTGAEPIIPDAWHVLQDVLDEFLSDPEGVANREPGAVSNLFEGLTLSGFAMQAAKSSRPASCCEHLFSHILDMTHHRFNGKLQSHGFQVAIGTLTMCAVFDDFLKYNLSKIDVDACVRAWRSLEEEQERALELFKDFPAPTLGYEQITKKYSDKERVRYELTRVKDNWEELRDRLRKQVYTFGKMQAMFKAVGAPYDPSMIGISRVRLKEMFPYVQLMRWRYNILDLAKRGRFYDQLAEAPFKKGAAWDLEKTIQW